MSEQYNQYITGTGEHGIEVVGADILVWRILGYHDAVTAIVHGNDGLKKFPYSDMNIFAGPGSFHLTGKFKQDDGFAQMTFADINELIRNLANNESMSTIRSWLNNEHLFPALSQFTDIKYDKDLLGRMRSAVDDREQ